MTTGMVASLVRQHADQLVGRLRFQDRAVIYEDAAAVGNEGVERWVVDDHHLDVLLLKRGRAQDGAGIFAQKLLGLAIAQDRRAPVLLVLRAHPGERGECKGKGDRDGGQAKRSLGMRKVKQHGRWCALVLVLSIGLVISAWRLA